MLKVSIHTDGSCRGNPGPGGWSAIIKLNYKGRALKRVVTGAADVTTNNQMELAGVKGGVLGLQSLDEPCEVVVYTDSANAVGWLSRGWKCRQPHIRKLVADITQAIREGGHVVSYEKVAAHSGDELNELADRLAREAIPR